MQRHSTHTPHTLILAHTVLCSVLRKLTHPFSHGQIASEPMRLILPCCPCFFVLFILPPGTPIQSDLRWSGSSRCVKSFTLEAECAVATLLGPPPAQQQSEGKFGCPCVGRSCAPTSSKSLSHIRHISPAEMLQQQASTGSACGLAGGLDSCPCCWRTRGLTACTNGLAEVFAHLIRRRSCTSGHQQAGRTG